jgi:hypothetical protein
VSCTEEDDLAYLSLELISPLADDWRFTTIPMTTRSPNIGEELRIVGFRFPEAPKVSDTRVSARGNLFAAAGTVIAVYYPIRHERLMPYPAIEIACGALGGMSGGAVLDRNGMLVGVHSKSYDGGDATGPAFASWVVGALARQLDVPWPPGLYKDRVGVTEIPEQLLHIAGRENVDVIRPGTIQYRVWFDRAGRAASGTLERCNATRP